MIEKLQNDISLCANQLLKYDFVTYLDLNASLYD